MKASRWALLLVLLGCTTHKTLERAFPDANERRVQLMRVESEIYGDFFLLRTFHNELMQVRVNETSGPYPAMDSLYHELFNLANDCVGRRVAFDSTFNTINLQWKVSNSSERAKLKARYEEEYYLEAWQRNDREKYLVKRRAYQDSCTANHIQRLGPEIYASMMNLKLEEWLDSLEECGRMVTKGKRDLKTRFPEQKGADFFAAYQPISVLEADMKALQSIISQLQNSISRFEEGNKQDIFYFGPFLRKRMEVQVTEDFLGQLTLKMKDCRLHESHYYRQYSR
ncbi:MAG: hypothetical protein ACKO6L_11355 [Flavobacteriales bacterium]